MHPPITTSAVQISNHTALIALMPRSLDQTNDAPAYTWPAVNGVARSAIIRVFMCVLQIAAQKVLFTAALFVYVLL